MGDFKVVGPFDVPVTKGKGGRTIARSDELAFWRQHKTLAKERGCYVFGLKFGRGIKPIYVGKATKTFGQEALASHKRSDHYNPAIVKVARGKPVLFLLVQPTTRGRVNKTEIKQLESFMIDLGLVRNPDLSNVQGAKKPSWGVKGVVRGKRGKPSKAAQVFKRMMGIDKK